MDFRRRLRGPDTLADTSVSARPLSDGPADCFVAPRAQRSHGSSGDCGGLFGGAHPLLRRVQPVHRYAAPRQHRESFVCRPPHHISPPRLMCRFVRFNTGLDHFCLCRSHTAGASVILCTSATPARPMVCVRWHCQVSRPRVVSWHCGTVFCTGMPLLQGAETGGQLAACITPRHSQGSTLEPNAHAA